MEDSSSGGSPHASAAGQHHKKSQQMFIDFVFFSSSAFYQYFIPYSGQLEWQENWGRNARNLIEIDKKLLVMPPRHVKLVLFRQIETKQNFLFNEWTRLTKFSVMFKIC